MDVPSPGLLARMPLAEAVLTLWRWAAEAGRLNEIFDESRGRCYEKVLSFSFMVYLIRDALVEFNGSAHGALKHARDRKELEASIPAAYGKLGRLPIAVSVALLRDCTARLCEIYPEAGTAQTPIPESLEAYRPMVLDGKAIKRVAKRLKPLRGLAGGFLGGRALVALDLRLGMAIAMRGHPDGDANEIRFVGDLVPTIRAMYADRLLFVADAAFCDLTQPAHFLARPGDAFLVRYHPKVPFFADPQRADGEGRDRQGRRYRQEWGWLGSPRNQKRLYVRRITLNRPGGEGVALVTNLLDADAVPAEDLLDVYLKRWGIERVFQQITEVFGLSHLIGTTPEGTVFQLALCLLLYNVIQVIRGVIAAGANRPREEISTENLFDDVHRELIAWNVVIDPAATIEHLDHDWTVRRVKARLRELLGGQWQDRWLKAKPKKKPPPAAKERKRTHGSVFRVLQAHQEKLRKQRKAAHRSQRC